jgi:uncharacterized membrane protein YqgA involved in biofilm formation
MDTKWITISEIPQRCALYVFSKRFPVAGEIQRFSVRVSADTRYRLSINGHAIAEGPCQSSPYVKYYDEVECGALLQNGENEIKAEVFHATTYDHYGVMPRQNKPALYLEGTLETSDGTQTIGTDESFCVCRAEHITFRGRLLPSVFPFEEVYGAPAFTPMTCVALFTPHRENGGYCPWGARDLYHLQPRPIPKLEAQAPTLLPVVREYVDEAGNYNLVLDAQRYTTAQLRYAFLAKEGVRIRTVYAECAQFPQADGTLSAGGSLLLVGCLTLGGLVGELLNIEAGFERFGEWLKKRTGNAKDGNFVNGFVTASLTVCIGAMAIVGAVEDGINGDISILVTKAILDLVIIMVMACSLGKGCLFSAIPVALWQGSITLISRLIAPFLTESALSNLSLIGSVLIFCVGVNLLFGKKIRVANLLPGVFLAVGVAFLPF